MSVHTFRQRTALQRAQQRWKPARTNHLRAAPTNQAKPTWLDRLTRLHDSRWPWLLAVIAILAADVHAVAQIIHRWRP